MNLVVTVCGALILFAFGYLVGVKRCMRLIAGYRPGRIRDEEAVARRFRLWCFGGGILVLLIGTLLEFT